MGNGILSWLAWPPFRDRHSGPQLTGMCLNSTNACSCEADRPHLNDSMVLLQLVPVRCPLGSLNTGLRTPLLVVLLHLLPQQGCMLPAALCSCLLLQDCHCSRDCLVSDVHCKASQGSALTTACCPTSCWSFLSMGMRARRPDLQACCCSLRYIARPVLGPCCQENPGKSKPCLNAEASRQSLAFRSSHMALIWQTDKGTTDMATAAGKFWRWWATDGECHWQS